MNVSLVEIVASGVFAAYVGGKVLHALWRARQRRDTPAAPTPQPIGPDARPQHRSTWVRRYGLPRDADWDEIYRAWKRQWAYWRVLVRFLPGLAVLPVLVLLNAQTPGAWILAAVLFVVPLALLSLGWAMALEDEYWGWMLGCKEIRARAVRDGYYVD